MGITASKVLLVFSFINKHYSRFPEEKNVELTYVPLTVFVADCPYEPYPGDSSKFWISGDENSLMTCVEGMQFFNNDDLCDCLPVTQCK